ncbi:hypothetical protein GS399_13925 [Pedobacter sp. HMF7647]|uniref:Uncharacterized protein n=1 Tax=Hufsiella arboris TaxID=2695275 RepID=A0A7K1YBW3_9SPHI|nr:hypothetical protein [Hufsiella arboris]MXV52073.1 hypothetical protein [Hufsiella arboris]
MNEEFLLPVSFGGREYEFKARLLSYGYVYRFEVFVEGLKVFFEPDEERTYRALVSPEDLHTNRDRVSVELLQAVAACLEGLQGGK